MNNKYAREFAGQKLDVYRIIELFDVTCPVAQHVLKKALCAGQRGHKNVQQDWQDISDSAARKLEMLGEDSGQQKEAGRNVIGKEHDGWFVWNGPEGVRPVAPEALICVRFVDGEEGTEPVRADSIIWSRSIGSGSVSAYKVLP